ncbi:MAG: Gfo/Idh/MocA family oxidoreductase [Ruminococcaceae bacterium]|nr:Gfo/Idh/MocA family oxidoreductase [Oscillospiraceae bacterium]
MDKVRYAVVGVNKEGIGRKHAIAITETEGAELVLLCDNDLEADRCDDMAGGVAAVAEELKVGYTYDYKDILTNDEIDAVVVATPDHLHRDIVVDLLNAGKHVLCEKPMALCREDCVAMIRAAKANDRFLMVGQIVRKNPTFIRAKEIIDSGEIGELVCVESEYAHDYSGMQSGWRRDPDHPRHIITGGGCHAVDMLRWIAGNPTEVFAYANHKVLKDFPVPDSTVAVVKFPNDVIGRVYCSMSAKRLATMRSVFYGTEGTLIVDDYHKEFVIYKDNIIEGEKKYLGQEAHSVEIRLDIEPCTHNCKGEIVEFTDVLLGKAPMTVDGVEGGSTVSVCEAIVKSFQTGEKVQISYDFFNED